MTGTMTAVLCSFGKMFDEMQPFMQFVIGRIIYAFEISIIFGVIYPVKSLLQLKEWIDFKTRTVEI